MKRKSLYLAAAIAELARFVALMLLSADFGATGDEGGMPHLFRYAAAPQLLFAAAFFFVWLDYGRYSPYRPLVIVGKLAEVVAIVPLAIAISYSVVEPGAGIRDPRSAWILAALLAVEDIWALAVAALSRPTGEKGAVAAKAVPAEPAIPPAEVPESVPSGMPAAAERSERAGEAEA